MHELEILSPSPPTYTFAVFTSSRAYLERVLELWAWLDPALYSGVSPGAERAIMPTSGQELTVYNITLRILQLNGGMDMAVSNVLSLMR